MDKSTIAIIACLAFTALIVLLAVLEKKRERKFKVERTAVIEKILKENGEWDNYDPELRESAIQEQVHTDYLKKYH